MWRKGQLDKKMNVKVPAAHPRKAVCWGGGQGGEMIQTMYAHVNKQTKNQTNKRQWFIQPIIILTKKTNLNPTTFNSFAKCLVETSIINM
jgi:hypothetical protein